MAWPRVRLGDIVSLQYGKSLPADLRDPHGKFPVAGSNGPHGQHTSGFVSSPGIVVDRKGSAGSVYWYDKDFWPIDTTYYVVPKMPLDMRWTFFLLSHLQLHQLATTTGVPGLNRNDVYNLEIQLPSVAEQRRIVETLDQADRLRRLRAKADATAVRILPALFIKMFGDPETNPMGWSQRDLGSQARIVTGNTPSTKNPEYYGSTLPWARPADLDRAPLVEHTARALSPSGRRVARVVPAKSVLVVCIGATLGKVAMAGSEMAINQQINAVLPSRNLLSEFLFTQCTLAASRFRAAATKSTLPILNKSKFAAQHVLVPPMEAQEKFVLAAQTKLSVWRWRSVSDKHLGTLFKVLLDRAFSSDLRFTLRTTQSRASVNDTERQRIA